MARNEVVPQERTEAVVLRGVDFSETSRIVTFLSPERGRLACMAKGARRMKGNLAASLDTFNRVELVYYWKDGRGIQTLGETSLLDDFHGLKSDLEKASYAAFPLELAYKVAHENEPSQPLYAALVTGFAGLSKWPGDARTHVCWEVCRLLSAAGYAPVLDACVHCGGPVDETPGFSNAGGVACRRCPSDRRLTEGDFSALRMVSRGGEDGLTAVVPAAVFRLLGQYAAAQLETDFRSVRVIEEMFG
jgi:DNA repair protein RecO (recombination protein O)